MELIETGSFFSGIGGLDEGFEREGFKICWVIERDPFCQAVLRKNFPDARIYGDIKQVRYDSIQKVRAVIGGFPCQDISQAGKGKGIEGERSGLWKHYAEGIRVLRPDYAVIENVPMLPSRGLDVVLADLAKMGYDAEWFCLSAQAVGAPHVRERIFIIAYISEFRQLHMEVQEHTAKGRQQTLVEITPSIITNDWGERVQRFRKESLQGEQGFSWCKDVRRVADFKGRRDIPQPLFRGARDGIPAWMDRIKSLGNAVVPQVAQFIARRIKEVEVERQMNYALTKAEAEE